MPDGKYHYSDDEIKKYTDSMEDLCESWGIKEESEPTGEIFSDGFIEECIDASSEARILSLKVLKNRYQEPTE